MAQPPAKRRRSSGASHAAKAGLEDIEVDELDANACAICLGVIDNKACVVPCEHNDFCFNCISSWCSLSRRCPLCNSAVEMLLTHVRSSTDFQRHFLMPLPATNAPSSSSRTLSASAIRSQLNQRHTHPRLRFPDTWAANSRRKRDRPEVNEVDEAELALQKRKFVYNKGLYAKHIGSNSYSRYRPYSVAQFAASHDFKTRIIRFVRRELLVFPEVDTEFLVTYIISIMSQLELRSDGAVRLLQEFLGDHADHFARQFLPLQSKAMLIFASTDELYCFARSPYTDPRNYDRVAAYDRPPCENDVVAESPDPSLPEEPAESAPREDIVAEQRLPSPIRAPAVDREAQDERRSYRPPDRDYVRPPSATSRYRSRSPLPQQQYRQGKERYRPPSSNNPRSVRHSPDRTPRRGQSPPSYRRLSLDMSYPAEDRRRRSPPPRSLSDRIEKRPQEESYSTSQLPKENPNRSPSPRYVLDHSQNRPPTTDSAVTELLAPVLDQQAPEEDSDGDYVISINGYEADYQEEALAAHSTSLLAPKPLATPAPEHRAASRERKAPRVRLTPLDTLNAHLKGGPAKPSGSRGIQISGLARKRDISSASEEPRSHPETVQPAIESEAAAAAKSPSLLVAPDRRSQLQARLLAEKTSAKPPAESASTLGPAPTPTLSLKDRLARERASSTKPPPSVNAEKATALMQRLRARLAIEKLQPSPVNDKDSSIAQDRRADLLARLEQARMEADVGERDEEGDWYEGEDQADLLAEEALRQQVRARLQRAQVAAM